MPSGSLAVVLFLALGYMLFIVEVVVPGGILGILGLLSVAYGCYIAFELGFAWGAGSITASIGIFGAIVYVMFRSKAGQHMMLEDEDEGRTWKAPDSTLAELMDQEGIAATPLRPAGVASFGDRRVDVVSDSEFLSTGTPIRVIEVEGSRVVVEATGPAPTSASEAPQDEAAAEADSPESIEAVGESDPPSVVYGKKS